jgi:hypothetical protein
MTEKSKLTKAYTSAPIDVLTSTNCPATAGRTTASQRGSSRDGPTRPNTVCAPAMINARISAK